MRFDVIMMWRNIMRHDVVWHDMMWYKGPSLQSSFLSLVVIMFCRICIPSVFLMHCNTNYITEFDPVRGMYTPNETLRFVYPVDSQLENQRSKIQGTERELEQKISIVDHGSLGQGQGLSLVQSERAASQSLIRSVGLLGRCNPNSNIHYNLM